MINMDKIDRVMEITDASYDEVRQALIDHDGDVDQAILALLRKKKGVEEPAGDNEAGETQDDEQQKQKEHEVYENPYQKQTAAFANDILDSVKELWERGNASSLIIEKDGKTVLHLSLTMSTLGLVIAPVAAFIGLGAALITEYTIKVILDDGDVINVNEMALTRKRSKQDKDKE